MLSAHDARLINLVMAALLVAMFALFAVAHGVVF